MFTGSLVAIVTPFRKGKVDERAFGDLIEWQIANGTNGIVPCGTTGESSVPATPTDPRGQQSRVDVGRQHWHDRNDGVT